MAANIQSAQDLFLHELGEMLYVERTLADQVLPQLGQEVQDQKLRGGIEQHRQQTQEHARNVERVFELMGQQPQPQQSQALDGLKASHDQLASNIQMEPLRDVFDAEAAAKTEHLEIAAYRGLIAMAQQMGQQEAQQLLETNCRQEEQALQQLESMSQQLTQQVATAG